MREWAYLWTQVDYSEWISTTIAPILFHQRSWKVRPLEEKLLQWIQWQLTSKRFEFQVIDLVAKLLETLSTTLEVLKSSPVRSCRKLSIQSHLKLPSESKPVLLALIQFLAAIFPLPASNFRKRRYRLKWDHKNCKWLWLNHRDLFFIYIFRRSQCLWVGFYLIRGISVLRTLPFIVLSKVAKALFIRIVGA